MQITVRDYCASTEYTLLYELSSLRLSLYSVRNTSIGIFQKINLISISPYFLNFQKGLQFIKITGTLIGCKIFDRENVEPEQYLILHIYLYVFSFDYIMTLFFSFHDLLNLFHPHQFCFIVSTAVLLFINEYVHKRYISDTDVISSMAKPSQE